MTLSGITDHGVILVDLAGNLIAGYASVHIVIQGAHKRLGTYDVYEHRQLSECSWGWSWYATFSDGVCIAQRNSPKKFVKYKAAGA